MATATKQKKAAPKKAAKKSTRRWSGRVTKTSDALDLQSRIFKSKDPKELRGL